MPTPAPPPGYIERERARLAAEYARLRRAEREFGRDSAQVKMLREAIASQEQDLAAALEVELAADQSHH